MKKLSPFTRVTCPVCGGQIDCKTDKAALVRHIRDEHPTRSIRQLVRAQLHKLNLSIPENIDEVGDEELGEVLTGLCMHEATKKGHKELRRKIRGR